MDDVCTTYEACAEFRASDEDLEICGGCGWAEADHVTVVVDFGRGADSLRAAS
jgi:hypothetical protein